VGVTKLQSRVVPACPSQPLPHDQSSHTTEGRSGSSPTQTWNRDVVPNSGWTQGKGLGSNLPAFIMGEPLTVLMGVLETCFSVGEVEGGKRCC
jgi:hypothetical protein